MNNGSVIDRIPPHVFFMVSAIFHYLGPSFAVLLFGSIQADGVAWLRIVSAAFIFSLWRRPWKAFLRTNTESKWLIVALGFTFAMMNYAFYHAIYYLPLGTVAGIEFLGPILVALVGVKHYRNYLALAFTSVGVYLLTDVGLTGSPVGFFWAFVNMVGFILYIIIANKITRSDNSTSSIDRLGIAMIFAAMAILPVGFESAQVAFGNIALLMAGLAVGVSSSVIPYILDQLAMARISPAVYSILSAILPAMAFLIGYIILDQTPVFMELIALIFIIFGVLLVKK